MELNTMRALYTIATGLDQRLKPLPDEILAVWAEICAEVPDTYAREVQKRLYSTRRISILQPGDILETWQEIKSEIDAAIGKCTRLAAKYESLEIEDKQDYDVAMRVYESWKRAYETIPEFIRSKGDLRVLDAPVAPREIESVPPPPEVRALVRSFGKGESGSMRRGTVERERDRQMRALEGM